ncbi:ABC transporter substrate-binding protein [Spirochaeta isovalerica]|uniref:Simple sugar transport system substrate-binding protein n=1 Tax=Spirochaeta isovalerica TaxID=150 RepID=A0A841R8C8_9SPIO|nr:simple sugar transport system substrate-binding protein [Spirochaeta isovalerica]
MLTLTLSLFTSCAPKKEPVPQQDMDDSIILGFSQIGAESAWRTFNSHSVKKAAEDAGIQLLFENAEQKQAKQIKAIRSFIVYQVDVIAFVPIVADGWDNVLTEAKDAGIPVLVTDRKINTSDETLYAGFIGTDSIREGREAALFLQKKFSSSERDKPVRIVEISGTDGASCVIGRAEGFRDIIDDNPDFEIIYSSSGDFLKSKGYEIMLGILDEIDNIDVLYSHNDGMTLGAIEAMKERGIRPGKDIVIVTIDAEQAAIDALRKGEVNCVIECNPRTGPVIMDLARKLAEGETIPRLMHVQEEVFTEWDDLDAIEPRGY